MSPEYFIIPIIIKQATSIFELIKTDVVVIDCLLMFIFIFLAYNTKKEQLNVKSFLKFWNEGKVNSITISTELNHRTIKFRAIMHYLGKQNNSIFSLKEDTEFDWDDNEKTSSFIVDQYKEFKLTNDIFGKIRNEQKEKNRNAQFTEMVDYNILKIYSKKLSLNNLQDWINEKVHEYKEYLKQTSNENQLFITISENSGGNGGGGGGDQRKKKSDNKTNIIVDSVEWDSSITFENSYFQNMDEIIKKINFFLNNKSWYLKKGIPYNLGILLHGEPGCGKTRFIKQLMNHTKRHGIDIKLSDTMDFTYLQNIIYKEEIDDNHIIPQNQRIIIFEDIDALGEVVKERDLKHNQNQNQNQKQQQTTSSPDSLGNIQDSGSESGSESGTAHLLKHILQFGNEESLNNISTNHMVSNRMVSNAHSHMMSFMNKPSLKLNNNLSYLLNILDGIHECSGRIIIMTTNHIDVLDKALIRPGRIDIKINFQKCTCYDIQQMIKKFWDINIDLSSINPEIEGKYTNAEVINIFRSTNDFETIQQYFTL
jgi:hypothetical protein